MADVIDFKNRTTKYNADGPTVQLKGQIMCMACGNVRDTIEVVTDEGMIWFDCKACGLHHATWRYPVVIGKQSWQCKCGWELFRINEHGAYCTRCGNYKARNI